MPVPRVLRRLPARAGIIAGLALLGGLGLLGGRLVALGGFSGKVGGAGTFQSATQLLSDAIGGTNCLSSTNSAGSIVSNTATCATNPLNQTAGGSQTVSFAAQGSQAPTAASGSAPGGCGVQQIADVADYADVAGTDTGLPQGGITPGVAGPTGFTDSPTAVSFDGTSGNIETATSIASPGPQTFSIALWFKTSSVSVPLMGFNNVQGTTGQSNYDRMLWLDSSGHLVFGVYPGSTKVFNSSATSTRSYADGAWHQVTVTVAPVSSTVGTVEIYADGSLVAGSASDETITSTQPAQAYAGYWHIGYANPNTGGWSPGTTTTWFKGTLADVAIFGSALSASQVSSLASATSQSGYRSSVNSDTPTSFWPLQSGPDPAVPVGANATLGAAGPTSTKAAMTDSPVAVGFGSSAYAETLTSISAPQTFSLGLWFKASADGSLLQFSTGQQAGQGTADRALWLNASGQLVFYLNPGSAYELTSPSGTSYADGNWHHVVITAAPASATKGTVLMYVDGASVAGAASDETITGSNVGATSAGYWQLGYSSGLSQSSPPNSAYLSSGSLADVSFSTTVLSSSQVSTLYGETTQAAYTLQILDDAPVSFWAMQDTGAGLYTGTVSDVGSSTPCSYLAVTVAAGGNCLYPAGSGSCPASPTTWLSTAPSFTIPAALPTLTLRTHESSSLPSAAAGLHVSVPWLFSTTGGGFSAGLSHPLGYVVL